MERMGTEYQIFNGKEYVSLRRFWNMEGKYKTEKAKNEELEEENKKLKEKLSEITMVADDEKQSIEHILELEEENRKLKEDNRFLTKISKEYMEKENIIQVTEFTGLYKDDLEKENERLREKIKHLEFDVDAWHQLKLLLEGEIEKLKETIKDHQLYEEKLEHRIIEFEELLHGE